MPSNDELLDKVEACCLAAGHLLLHVWDYDHRPAYRDRFAELEATLASGAPSGLGVAMRAVVVHRARSKLFEAIQNSDVWGRLCLANDYTANIAGSTGMTYCSAVLNAAGQRFVALSTTSEEQLEAIALDHLPGMREEVIAKERAKFTERMEETGLPADADARDALRNDIMAALTAELNGMIAQEGDIRNLGEVSEAVYWDFRSAKFAIAKESQRATGRVPAWISSITVEQKIDPSNADGGVLIPPDLRSRPLTADEVCRFMGLNSSNPSKTITSAGIAHERIGRKYVVNLDHVQGAFRQKAMVADESGLTIR